MLYTAFVGQAEKRMMNLHKRLSDALFMQKILEEEMPAQATEALGQRELGLNNKCKKRRRRKGCSRSETAL